MTPQAPRPPLLGRLLLNLCPLGARREDAAADLADLFDARVATDGTRAASRRYISDVVSLWIDAGVIPRLGDLRDDLRHAWRVTRHHRGTSAAVVFTLTLGITANAVMFGLVDQLLLSAPAGLHDAHEIRQVHFGSEANARAFTEYSHPVVAAIRARIAPLAESAVTFVAEGVTVGSGPEANRATVELANANYFPLLGTRLHTGRWGNSDHEPVVVLSHRYWMRQFGGQAVLGQPIRLNDTVLTIAGVAAPGFSGASREVIDIWTPIGAMGPSMLGRAWATNYGRFGFGLIARVTDDASLERITAESTDALRAAVASSGAPFIDPTEFARFLPMTGIHTPNGIRAEAKVSLWLLGVAAIVLVAAVANVANLLLNRALSRRREIGVSLALGIGRGRLIRQLLAESSLLALISATAALGLSWIAASFIQQTLLPGFAWNASLIDGRVLGITAAAAALAAIASGLAPAALSMRVELLEAMRASRSAVRGREGRWRNVLLVTQVATTVVLLVGAGLFVQSLRQLNAMDFGLDLDHVVAAAPPPRAGAPRAEADQLYLDVRDRVASIPGVVAVAVSRGSAPMLATSSMTLIPEGRTSADIKGLAAPFLYVVTQNYFATLGTTIEQGRGFDAIDDPRVAVLNRAAAAQYWPDVTGALGQCVSLGSDTVCTRVVGIVENSIHSNRTRTNTPHVYLLESHPVWGTRRPGGLLIRTSGLARELVPAVRQALRSLRSDLLYIPVDSLAGFAAPQLQPWRMGMTTFLVFGGMAFVLAIVGLGAAMGHLVSQRQREIGIRIALGASRARVMSAACADGGRIVVVGAVAGALIVAGAANRFSELLFQTSPTDPTVITLVAVVLGLGALVAALIPARRAASVDPLITLKAE